ncbi:hypothetical protein QN351_19500, partial [Cryobacterium sp. 10C2]
TIPSGPQFGTVGIGPPALFGATLETAYQHMQNTLLDLITQTSTSARSHLLNLDRRLRWPGADALPTQPHNTAAASALEQPLSTAVVAPHD